MGYAFQINVGNKRYTKLTRPAKIAKRSYHRFLRHLPIEEDDHGGHVIRKYPGGWMY